MSALGTAVKARYNNAELASLTQSGTSLSTSTIDDVRLELAVDDVVAAFLTPHGIVFDSGNARHVEVAVEGVVLRLRCFGKAMDRNVRQDWRKWKTDELDRLAKGGPRARVQPKSSSPSRDTEPARLNAERFDDYVPDAPNVGSDSTSED